jgi:DNA polymerase III sliding clamp (beta) subunit (PCNA family)
MRDTLNLVRGAVSTKDLLPVLTHFHIYDGRVQGGNGRIAIDAPCPELAGFDCTVPAERFLKAVDACDGEPRLKLTAGGKLIVSKGKFRAMLPLANHAAFPKITREHKHSVQTPRAKLLPVLRKLYSFIGEDASRAWSCGVFFSGGYAWATNNVVLARVPYDEPRAYILPIFAVDELLRIGQEPAAIENEDNALSFGFVDGWWMRCQKLEGAWPDVAAFLPAQPSDSYAPAKALADAVRKVQPFCPDPKHPVIQTGPEGVSTLDGDMSASVGHDGLPPGRFRAEPLLAVLDAAAGIDLSTYPKACYWRGAGIDGVIVGLRQ